MQIGCLKFNYENCEFLSTIMEIVIIFTSCDNNDHGINKNVAIV